MTVQLGEHVEQAVQPCTIELFLLKSCVLSTICGNYNIMWNLTSPGLSFELLNVDSER